MSDKYATIEFSGDDIISVNSKVLEFPYWEGFWARYEPADLADYYVGPFADQETADKSANHHCDYREVVYCHDSGLVSFLDDCESKNKQEV